MVCPLAKYAVLLGLLVFGGNAMAADPVRQALREKLAEASAFFARRPHLYRGTGHRFRASEIVRFLFGDLRYEVRSKELDHLLGSSKLNVDNRYFLPLIPRIPLSRFLPVDRACKAEVRAAIVEALRGRTLEDYAEAQYWATYGGETGFGPTVPMAVDQPSKALSYARESLERTCGSDVARLQAGDRFPLVVDCDAGPDGSWLPGAPLERREEFFAFSHLPVVAVRGVLVDLGRDVPSAYLRVDDRQGSGAAKRLSVHRFDPASGETSLVATFIKGCGRHNRLQGGLMLRALPVLQSLLPALLEQSAQ